MFTLYGDYGMSWEATAYVKNLTDTPSGETLTQPEKLVLFVLADYHNPERRISWPSIETLSQVCLCSDRQMQIILKELNRKGIILTVRPSAQGRGHFLFYVFVAIDPDPRLQHSINHEDCPACKDLQKLGKKSARKGERHSPFRPVEDDNSAQEGRKLDPKRVNKTPQKGEQTTIAIRKSSRAVRAVEPSTSGEVDSRHFPIREFIKQAHSEANNMPLPLVPWEGREGAALAQWLRNNPKVEIEHAQTCVRNYYGTAANVSQRPARFIPHLLEFWKRKEGNVNGRQKTRGEANLEAGFANIKAAAKNIRDREAHGGDTGAVSARFDFTGDFGSLDAGLGSDHRSSGDGEICRGPAGSLPAVEILPPARGDSRTPAGTASEREQHVHGNARAAGAGGSG